MKKALTSMTDAELIVFVSEELKQFKQDAAAKNEYGTVKLSDIQAYSKALQRVQFNAEGKPLYDELKAIVDEYTKPTEDFRNSRRPVSMYEFHRRQNGFGNWSRKL